MSIQDVLKKSFLNQFNSDLSTTSIVGALILTALIGTYIFVIYRAVCRKAFYSKSFAISLPVISMITASIIISIQSSVVISLGMVGALSIVRFRTAVKDPMDLAFLFWTISVGIICGAGLFEVAVEASILITIVMLLLHFVPNVKPALLLLVNGTDSKLQAELEQVLKDGTRFYKIKSRNMTGTGIDMIVELKAKDESTLMEKGSRHSRSRKRHSDDPRRRNYILNPVLTVSPQPIRLRGNLPCIFSYAKTALVTQSGFNCFHEGLVELSLVLTGSFGLLLPLQAGADVMLALLNLSDHAFLGTAALKTTQSALQRLVLLDANFRHCFPSLRWHPAQSRMLSGPYRLDTL